MSGFLNVKSLGRILKNQYIQAPILINPNWDLDFHVHIDVFQLTIGDAPLNSWIDSNVSPKVKTIKGQGIRAHSLIHNISGVEGRAGTLVCRLGRTTSKSIIHMDLHKPNNKLSSA